MTRYSLLIGLTLGVGAIIALHYSPGAQDMYAECAGIARDLAERNHRPGDRTGFRWTERRAYQACIADPIGFRRLMRTD
jgi:hypothetical protein